MLLRNKDVSIGLSLSLNQAVIDLSNKHFAKGS
ncbi:unnamed protein product, partial [Allacma fusca]